jgi:hypothetical protein
VNPLGDKIDIIKKNTETLTDVSKEVGLKVNVRIYVAVSSPECRAQSSHKDS